MKAEDIKTVIFTVLNPRGCAVQEGRCPAHWEGGNHNGYVAIPMKFESLLDFDREYNEYTNLPGVHGGCTFTVRDYTAERFAKWHGTEIVSGQFEEEEKYFVVGFDTLHYNDTEAKWPKDAVVREAMEWDFNIRTLLVELAEQQVEANKVAAAEQLHALNVDAIHSSLPAWGIEEVTGYKPCTTFWQDFSMADVFVLNGQNPDAVLDTHSRSWPTVKEMGLGVEGITEYVMVLNWKIHQHYPKQMELSELYDTLWKETDEWCMENLKGEDLNYYLDTTD